ncbi:MAG: Ig-like domain-containing protein [Gemmatimonadales bacterium]
MNNVRWLRRPGMALIALIMSACGGDNTPTIVPPPPVATVSVELASTRVEAGTTTTASAMVRDAGGQVLAGRTVVWSSSDVSVATVSEVGVVTAIASGLATITATTDGVIGSAAVTVLPPVVSTVSLTTDRAYLSPGMSTTIMAVLRDARGGVLGGRGILWASRNPGVATVTAAGVVNGVTPGTTYIAAASERGSGLIRVTVSLPIVAALAVVPGNPTLALGRSASLAAVATTTADEVLRDLVVAWSTSDPAVATISAEGVVAAVAPGTATISAAAGGVTGEAMVTVSTVAVASVTFEPVPASLWLGVVGLLVATPRDAGGNPLLGRVVTWAFTEPTVLNSYMYADTALVTGLMGGTATVTATVEGKSVSREILVVDTQWDICSQIAGASVVASDETYLGRLTNRRDPQSIYNESGEYGSPYNPFSIANRHGPYGSPHSPESPWNIFARTGPRLVKNGIPIAVLSVNEDINFNRLVTFSPGNLAGCKFP